MMSSELLRVGEVAAQAGVSVDTVRHYERKGVLRDVWRDESGYRRYPPHTVRQILLIRKAISLGFSLDELADIFRERAAGKAPCRRVRDLAARKLSELEERIAALESLRAVLAETISAWDDRLRNSSDGGIARLLESIIE